MKRQKAAEHPEEARAASEAMKHCKDVQEAAERQETARLEEESKHVDAMFEKLDERTRKRVDEQAVAQLGILRRSGRAQAALVAMRRNVLREMLGKTVHEK